jgi:phosphate transport system permease protein
MSRAEYQNLAAAGIVVLLALLVGMNSIAIFIRHRFQKRIRW